MFSSDEMEMPVDDLEVDQFDKLMDHSWLQFPNKRDRLLRKEMGQQKAIDYDLLAELGQLERMTTIIGQDTPWSRVMVLIFSHRQVRSSRRYPSDSTVPRTPCLWRSLGVFSVYTPRRRLRCRSTRRLFIQLTTLSSVLGGLGSVTSRLSALPRSRVFVTRSLGICTGALPRLLQDVT
ncbi:hypothetical protein R6Q57_014347 [Mikania cordata]